MEGTGETWAVMPRAPQSYSTKENPIRVHLVSSVVKNSALIREIRVLLPRGRADADLPSRPSRPLRETPSPDLFPARSLNFERETWNSPVSITPFPRHGTGSRRVQYGLWYGFDLQNHSVLRRSVRAYGLRPYVVCLPPWLPSLCRSAHFVV